MPLRLLLTLCLMTMLSQYLSAQDPEQKETISSTEHKITVNGQTIEYTAQAGTLPIKNDKGEVTARMFHIAYLKKGEDAARRPVLFAFNGGPGSSSVWLHMGIFGPKRIKLNDDGSLPKPPFEIVVNNETMLDLCDLVFIDPVSTGYSRVPPGKDAKEFHGVEGDLRSVAEFIRLWTSRHNRWSSPKYVGGESYGTTRAAGLSSMLQSAHGISLNGVILVSAVLNFQTIRFDDGNDLPFAMFLPSYTATAWYHKKLGSELQSKPLSEVVEQARQFAEGEYSKALMQGHKMTDAERSSIAVKVARLTGLSDDYVLRANLRVDAMRFMKELLRDKRESVGRYDSRLKSTDFDADREMPNFDASYAAVQGPYTQALNQYVRTELKYESDAIYRILTGDVQPWDYGNARNRYLNHGTNLQSAMTQNQHLKVFLANGYYDLATPFFASEYTMAHLGSNPTVRSRIISGYYEAGHMMYIQAESRLKLKQDLRKFMEESAK